MILLAGDHRGDPDAERSAVHVATGMLEVLRCPTGWAQWYDYSRGRNNAISWSRGLGWALLGLLDLLALVDRSAAGYLVEAAGSILGALAGEQARSGHWPAVLSDPQAAEGLPRPPSSSPGPSIPRLPLSGSRAGRTSKLRSRPSAGRSPPTAPMRESAQMSFPPGTLPATSGFLSSRRHGAKGRCGHSPPWWLPKRTSVAVPDLEVRHAAQVCSASCATCRRGGTDLRQAGGVKAEHRSSPHPLLTASRTSRSRCRPGCDRLHRGCLSA